MNRQRRTCLAAGLALWGVSRGRPALASAYPTRPISIVVPFAPGGNVDLTARIMAEALTAQIGQSVVVLNKAGAGGSIGAAYVAQSAPDGYTLLVTVPDTMTVLPRLVKTSYRREDFQPISPVAATTPLLVVRRASRFATLQDLMAAAKDAPGKVTIGQDGIGSTSQIVLSQFAQAAGCRVNSIPYKGSSPALADVLGGQIDAAVDQMTSSLSHLRSGQLRALAVMSGTRDPSLPDVPTLREQGVAFDAVTLLGVYGPHGMTPDLLAQLNGTVRKAVADSAVQRRMLALGSVAQSSSMPDFEKLMAREDQRARALARSGVLANAN